MQDTNPYIDMLGRYVLIRSKNAGVFTGILFGKKDQEVILKDARRIWYWSGAASLSQLAMEGTCDPDKCKFPCEVDTIVISEVLEIILVTEKAKKSIKAVKVWEAKAGLNE